MTDETTETVAADPAAPSNQEPAAPAVQPADTQAEPAAAGQTDEAAASEDQPGNDSADESKPKRKGGGFQKKIDDLTRDKYKERLEKEDLQREVEALRKKLAPTAITELPPKPTLDQFASIEDYDKAMDGYRDQVAEKAKQDGYKQAQQERNQQTEAERALTIRATLAAREDAARQKHADYDRVVDAVAPVIMGNPVLSQYVTDPNNDLGPDVAYHLAKNPHKLAELSQMPPMNAARELFKLEERLKASPPPKPITKAPDPIKPVGARETVATTLGDLAKSDDAGAYIARANKMRRPT